MVKSEKISAEDQQKYPLGIGMLLYLVKHLHPDLANATRECQKQMTVQTLQPTRNSNVLSGMH